MSMCVCWCVSVKGWIDLYFRLSIFFPYIDNDKRMEGGRGGRIDREKGGEKGHYISQLSQATSLKKALQKCGTFMNCHLLT